jgi:hypothetical protein
MAYRYREEVLSELARHGVIPREDTPPELIHAFVNNLYLFEIRVLKRRLKAGLIPKPEYARHVEQLRKRYPILSLPEHLWFESRPPTGA